MTIAIQPDEPTALNIGAGALVNRLPGIATAAAASIGAGIVHAGAIGIHAEHTGLARLFIAVACFQLAWGMVALFKPSRWLAVVGAVGNLTAVAIWLTTRLTGISFIGGLEVREAAQFTDTACALLGLVAGGLALSAALIGWRQARPTPLMFPALVVAAITIPAMITGSAHVHSHTITSASGNTVNEALPHNHDASGAGASGASAGATTDTVHVHTPAAVPTVAYDPTKPIDLGGVPGVTPEEQAAAENLVAVTVVRLPQWADYKTAEAAGFHSIGDGITGFEHFINWGWIDDNVTLDPDHPESLVYQPQADGSKKLVFCSAASNLVTGDGNGPRDIFLVDPTNPAQATQLVSTDASGVQLPGDSCEPTISVDGTQVAFTTSAPSLYGTPARQVVRKDLTTGALDLISVSTAGPGHGANADSSEPAISADGSVIAFTSQASNLDGLGAPVGGREAFVSLTASSAQTFAQW